MAVIQRQRSVQAQGPQGLQARSVEMGDDNAIRATGQKHRTAAAGIWRRQAGGGGSQVTYRLCVVVVIVFILSQRGSSLLQKRRGEWEPPLREGRANTGEGEEEKQKAVVENENEQSPSS